MAVQRPRSRGAFGGGLLSVSVVGSDKLGDLAKRLRETGRRELSRELQRELRKPPRRLESAVRAEVRPAMPKGYEVPLGSSLRLKTTVRTRGASGAGVRVAMSSGRDIRPLNQGRLRHPVFGRTRRTTRGRVFDNPWVSQRIPPGFFTRPAERVLGQVRQEMVRVIDRVLAKIGDG